MPNLVRKQRLRNVMMLVYDLGQAQNGTEMFRIEIAHCFLDTKGEWQPCGAPTELDRLDVEEAERLGEEWLVVD